MLKKGLILAILLVSCALAQPSPDSDQTAGMQNGRFWKAITTKIMKDMYIIATLDVARSLKIHPLLRGETCTSLNTVADSIIVAPLTGDETEAELDKFYSEPSNAPVPIVLALSWVNAKARGNSRESLDGLESTLRAWSVRVDELTNRK